MDPNTVLAEIRSLIAKASESETPTESHRHLADASYSFEALDEWLSSGGFLPTAWQRSKTLASEPTASDIVNAWFDKN